MITGTAPLPVVVRTPNPWRTIWFAPRRTTRQLLDAERPPSWMPLIVLAVVSSALAVVNDWLASATWTYAHLVQQLVLILAFWLGWATVGVRLLAAYGRWRGGRAEANQLRLVSAFAYLPWIVASACWVPLWIVTNGAGAQSFDGSRPLVGNVLYLLLQAGSYWAAVTSIVAVAEAHGFSVWRAIESVMISALPLLVPYAILALSLMP